jgi:hypothetical protein
LERFRADLGSRCPATPSPATCPNMSASDKVRRGEWQLARY